MASMQLKNLDCKVELRKYVWMRASDTRIMVKSPIINILDTSGDIPVKLFRCEGDNSVQFIPKNELKEDSSLINGELRVSKTRLLENAHGVALVDSSFNSKFKYRRGDLFWIWIGPETNKYKTEVPVINLRTFGSGTIAIHHVCWYPTFQGPEGEIWTLGGEIRKRKLPASKMFDHFTWTICQRLDGSQATTKDVKILAGNAKIEGIYELSLADSQSIFQKRREIMMQKQLPDISTLRARLKRGAVSVSSGQRKLKPAMLTPPCSPSLGDIEASWSGNRPPLNPLSLAAVTDIKTCKVPFESPTDCNMSECSTLTVSTRSQRSSQDGICSSPSEDPELGLSVITKEIHENRMRDPDHDAQDGGADESSRPAFSVTNKYIINDPTLISLVVKREQSSLTGPLSTSNHNSTALLCDRNEPTCQYSSQFNYGHFHSPLSKCVLPQSDGMPPHEHCISRLNTMPGRAGDCILSSYPSRNHKCCWWKPEDQVDWPKPVEPNSVDGSGNARTLIEAAEHDTEMHDRSGFVEQMETSTPVSFSGWDLHWVLDDAGRDFWNDLESGNLDAEICAMEEHISTSG